MALRCSSVIGLRVRDMVVLSLRGLSGGSVEDLRQGAVQLTRRVLDGAA
jgi:hypothetical protein